MRLAPVLIIVTASAVAVRAEPDHVAIEAGEEMGFMAASHARVTGSYGRRLATNRLFVEAQVGAGVGTFESLLVLDQRFAGGFPRRFACSVTSSATC